MNYTLRFLSFVFVFIFCHTALFSQSSMMQEVELRRQWDNFRTRDASVFRFYFGVSEAFFSKNLPNTNVAMSSASSTTDLSGYGKYAVLKVTEEILSDYTQKSVIVPDPELAAKKSGGKIPGTGKQIFKGSGFIDFPYWTKKNFLKYDDSVPKMIEIQANLTERSHKVFFNPTLEHYDLRCEIKLVVYDRDGNKLATYKHRKERFQALSKSRSRSRFANNLFETVWQKDIKVGTPIPYLIDCYVQTLEELLANNPLKLDELNYEKK